MYRTASVNFCAFRSWARVLAVASLLLFVSWRLLSAAPSDFRLSFNGVFLVFIAAVASLSAYLGLGRCCVDNALGAPSFGGPSF